MKVAVAGLLFLLADVRVLAQVPAAPADLASICDQTDPDFCTTGIETCRSTCAVAACCGAQDQAQNCLADNLQTCPSYVPCGSVLSNNCAAAGGGDAAPVVPEAPADIATLCDNAAEDFCTVGSAGCVQACAPAGCCAATDETNCSVNQLATCLGYAVCAVLASCPEGSLPIPDGTSGVGGDPPATGDPPADGMDPPADGMDPPADGMDTPADGMDTPATDGDGEGEGDDSNAGGDGGDANTSEELKDAASAQKIAGILTVSLVAFLSTIL